MGSPGQKVKVLGAEAWFQPSAGTVVLHAAFLPILEHRGSLCLCAFMRRKMGGTTTAGARGGF